MKQLTAKVQTINPYAVIYGEPWTGGTSAMPNFETNSAKQSNGNKYVGYGQFNDMTRDALIKSGMNADNATGWITNPTSVNASDVKAIAKGITGSTYGGSYEIADPNKTVNYVTCHDNYTLFDRMRYGLNIKDRALLLKASLLAEAVIFTAAGTAFMQGGEEFLRSKGGNHNSYESPDSVNQFNYEQIITAYSQDMTNFYANFKKLVAFKQNTPQLHSNNCSDITVNQLDGGATFKYELGNYVVIHTNGVGEKGTINLGGNYEVYLDTLNANEVGATLTSVTPVAYQTLILLKK